MARLKEIKGIVVHVSASTWGDWNVINSWHIERGWSKGGYHGVILNGVRSYKSDYDILLDGHIQPGRSESEMGAHCLAKGMNTCSIGVCCIGNPGWPVKGVPAAPKAVTVRPYLTQKQYDSLIFWLKTNCLQYGIDPLGTMVRPGDKKVVPTITQHSTHDSGKPLCASLRMEIVRKDVAALIKKG